MNDDVGNAVLVGLVLWPVAAYAARFAAGWQVRAGEKQFMQDWLHNQLGDRDRAHSQLYLGYHNQLATRNSYFFAQRYANDGEPFIIVNQDHIGEFAGGAVVISAPWLLGRRLRRLADRIAAREHIPVLPIPFTTWEDVPVDVKGAAYQVIHRRRRECVFTQTLNGDVIYWLSGFDRNEFPALYFLTRLPCPVESIEDAREALKPASVATAEKSGRTVRRQGDMFVIPTEMTDDQIVAAGGIFTHGHSLYGTAHHADVVASLPDGTQLAKGAVRHKPPHRTPDHHPLKLKHGWHIVAKNTTPMTPPPEGEGV